MVQGILGLTRGTADWVRLAGNWAGLGGIVGYGGGAVLDVGGNGGGNCGNGWDIESDLEDVDSDVDCSVEL